MSDSAQTALRRHIESRLERLGLTPITAATKAGLPRDTIRNLFRQGGSLRVDTLVKIAEALETSAAFLLGEEDDVCEAALVDLNISAQVSPALAAQVLALLAPHTKVAVNVR